MVSDGTRGRAKASETKRTHTDEMEQLTQAQRLWYLKADAARLMTMFADTNNQRAQMFQNPYMLATRAEQILVQDPDLHRARLFYTPQQNP